MSAIGSLSAATLMTATTGVIECMVFPVFDGQLLLPLVNVMDHVASPELVRPKRAANWFLGTLHWKELDVPVVSFEVLNNRPAAKKIQHIVILQAVHSEGGGYYGLGLQAAPRPANVRLNGLEDLLEWQDRLGPVESLAVRWQGEMLVIPNLEAIEKVLLQG